MIRGVLRSLRVRFALVAFAAIYLPVAVLAAATLVVEQDVTVAGSDQGLVQDVEVTARPSPILVAVAVLMAPMAAVLAWWLAGRAVRPVQQAVAVQERLVAEVGHELRTPLAVLTTNAEVLLGHPEPSLELYRDGLERSRSAAGRMTTAVEALLVDARVRARTITVRAADLGAVARSVVADLAPMAAARAVPLVITGDDAPVTAAVDEPSVRRAVTNLVVNAIEHSPPEQPVVVAIGMVGGHEDDGRSVVVSVIDRGPGVATADRAWIFDRFRTGRADGAGLGLAVVRQVAEAHGGSIEVEDAPAAADRPGPGACFVLRLPVGATARPRS